MKLTLAVLVDRQKPKKWVNSIIKGLSENPDFKLSILIVNQSRKKDTSSHKLLYRLLRKVDRKLFPFFDDAFTITGFSLEDYFNQVIYSNPTQSRFTDVIEPEVIDQIKSVNPDVILRFGFRILKGDILHIAKFGVWSLHHGDNAVNRGGPPAFWEVANKEPVTGITLQKLSDQLDGGEVIDKSFIRTDTTSFNRNANKAFWAGVELMMANLNYLAHHGRPNEWEGEKNNISPYHYPLYKDPDNSTSLQIGLNFFVRRLQGWVYHKLRSKQWHIGFIKHKSSGSEAPIYRYKQLSASKGTDWADPFLLEDGDNTYCFFEEKSHLKENGHISCINLSAASPTETYQIVLQEDYHLSYPFVFEFEDNRYMIPEAAECGKVWLYRCVQFPNRWTKDILLLEEPLYDPTLHYHEGCWYLFGSQKPLPASSADQFLYIYTAHTIKGPWNPHPANPQTRDVRVARPAGKLFYKDGRLIRPAQLSAPVYGYGIVFMHVKTLTPEVFEEEPLGTMEPKWSKGLHACHTWNRTEKYTVIDYQR